MAKAFHLIEKSRDPLGHGLLDYYEKTNPGLITVYADLADPEYLNPGYFFRNFPEFPDLEKVAVKCCHGSTLDVGAGAGAHALALQTRMTPVTAIDASELAVDVMKKRGIEHVHLADFFGFEEGHYDTILMLMNGLGIAGNLEGLSELLKRAKRLLKNKGQLIADSSDVAYLFEDEAEREAWSQQMNQYYGQITYRMSYKSFEGEPFQWLFVDYATLKDVAFKQGYQCERIYTGPNHQYLARLTFNK